MKIDVPYLLIEINEDNIIFLVVKYNYELDFIVLEKKTIKSSGINKGKIIDINILSNIIKESLNEIEKKLSHTFKKATIISDQNNISFINVSGYKKISGSQFLEQDVSYILNNLKKTIMDIELKYSLIHLFNTSFVLDGENLENMPIGLYGDFYNHHLTFVLAMKNDIKNLKLVLNKCHIDIEKIILKPFAQNIFRLKKTHANKIKCFIDINKRSSSISIFQNLSFIYHQKFNFGTDIIVQDICKLCSLKFNEVENILSKINLNKNDNEKEFLSENYFTLSSFRKISLKHIEDIVFARVKEIFELIYEKNINLAFLKSIDKEIQITSQEQAILSHIKPLIKVMLQQNNKIDFIDKIKEQPEVSCLSAAELIGKGWEREAIPIIQTKKSLITRIFSNFFK